MPGTLRIENPQSPDNPIFIRTEDPQYRDFDLPQIMEHGEDVERNVGQGLLMGLTPGTSVIRRFPSVFGRIGENELRIAEVTDNRILTEFNPRDGVHRGSYDKLTGIHTEGPDYGWITLPAPTEGRPKA